MSSALTASMIAMNASISSMQTVMRCGSGADSGDGDNNDVDSGMPAYTPPSAADIAAQQAANQQQILQDAAYARAQDAAQAAQNKAYTGADLPADYDTTSQLTYRDAPVTFGSSSGPQLALPTRGGPVTLQPDTYGRIKGVDGQEVCLGTYPGQTLKYDPQSGTVTSFRTDTGQQLPDVAVMWRGGTMRHMIRPTLSSDGTLTTTQHPDDVTVQTNQYKNGAETQSSVTHIGGYTVDSQAFGNPATAHATATDAQGHQLTGSGEQGLDWFINIGNNRTIDVDTVSGKTSIFTTDPMASAAPEHHGLFHLHHRGD